MGQIGSQAGPAEVQISKREAGRSALGVSLLSARRRMSAWEDAGTGAGG